MKVCVIGTHGVGKTTLVNHVAKIVCHARFGQKKELLVAPELAKDVINALKYDWRTADFRELYYFQMMLFHYSVLVSLQPGPLLQDRSPLDACVYWSYRTGIDWVAKKKTELLLAMGSYDWIYFYYRDFKEGLTQEQKDIQDRLLAALEFLGFTNIRYCTRAVYNTVVEEIADLFVKGEVSELNKRG